jgi:frizzled protein 1/7
MNKFGFQWPESLECSRYPEGGAAGELCVGENNTSSGTSHGGNDGYRPPYKVSGKLLLFLNFQLKNYWNKQLFVV